MKKISQKETYPQSKSTFRISAFSNRRGAGSAGRNCTYPNQPQNYRSSGGKNSGSVGQTRVSPPEVISQSKNIKENLNTKVQKHVEAPGSWVCSAEPISVYFEPRIILNVLLFPRHIICEVELAGCSFISLS